MYGLLLRVIMGGITWPIRKRAGLFRRKRHKMLLVETHSNWPRRYLFRDS